MAAQRDARPHACYLRYITLRYVTLPFVTSRSSYVGPLHDTIQWLHCCGFYVHSYHHQVTLDYTGRLFLPLYRFRRNSLVPQADGNGVCAAWERQEPLCFIHANGYRHYLGFPLKSVSRASAGGCGRMHTGCVGDRSRRVTVALLCVVLLLVGALIPAVTLIMYT